MEKTNLIPALDNPYGPGSWDQPSRHAILTDDKHALMTQGVFDRLSEYSATMPSGVYPGKMWKRHDGSHDPNRRGQPHPWLLGWYGIVDENKCSINFREILIV